MNAAVAGTKAPVNDNNNTDSKSLVTVKKRQQEVIEVTRIVRKKLNGRSSAVSDVHRSKLAAYEWRVVVKLMSAKGRRIPTDLPSLEFRL